MNYTSVLSTVRLGLAIFSMFFGAGNLMFPIKVGLNAGSHTLWAMAGFLLTAILLPTIGLTSMTLFDGNYFEFFKRIGRVPGFGLLTFSLLVIGPLIAMPRIVTLSYTMFSPFIPMLPVSIFSLIFLSLTFIACYKESKIIDILGLVISPLLLASLLIIIIKGMLIRSIMTTPDQDAIPLFFANISYGYNTLDVLGSIFFASIVLTILRQTDNSATQAYDQAKQRATRTLQAGAIGTSLLGIIYLGLSYLGAYFGHGLEKINEGELFSALSFKILGTHGAFVVATAVLMACFSTIIALAAIFADFVHTSIGINRMSYTTALTSTLAATFLTSQFELGPILKFSVPIIRIAYPAIIVLTVVNLAYKVWGFKPVKTPVYITLIINFFHYMGMI